MHDVVLALTLAEVHPRHPLIPGEAAHRRGEHVGDLSQRRGRGDRQAELALDVAEQAAGVLQLGNVDVAVHPVDALHLEHHMIGQDIGDTARGVGVPRISRTGDPLGSFSEKVRARASESTEVLPRVQG